MDRPRILCIADVFPWPARSGYQIRLDHVLRTLADAGEVDLFAATPHPGHEVPSDVALERVMVSPLPYRRQTLPRMLASGLPRRVLSRDWRTVGTALRSWALAPYDLVWYSHADSMAGAGLIPARRHILDADNLEDMRIRSLRKAHLRGLTTVLAHPGGASDLSAEVRYRLKGVLSSFEAGRWDRLQRRLAATADAIVVCSELDRRRLGIPNAVVIPNGYAEPIDPPDRAEDGNVMSMVGALHYPPNADAARFFARDVLPRIRARIPDATVRLIGRHDGYLKDLAGLEGVELTGEVADVPTELASARVAVVPLRSGSGTRVKVLEAFACRIPLVSTSIGCEGLDVVPERHLLVADDPGAFADACVRLLSDERLRNSLVHEGYALFASTYRWRDIREQLRRVIDDFLGERAAALQPAAP